MNEKVLKLFQMGSDEMDKLAEEKKIRTLLGKAITHSSKLTAGREEEVGTSLDRVLSILDVPVIKRNQISLLLSAATREIRSVEDMVIKGMLGDDWICQNEMAMLVHIRLICHALLMLLTSASEELRMVPVRVH